jgi:hypothetical protein
MTDIQEAISRLDQHARELQDAASALTKVQRLLDGVDEHGRQTLQPIDAEYQQFLDSHELGLYRRSLEDPDFKLPAEKLREKLARADMPPELLGRHEALVRKRARLKAQIANLKALIDAERSLLSAQKELASV